MSAHRLTRAQYDALIEERRLMVYDIPIRPRRPQEEAGAVLHGKIALSSWTHWALTRCN